MEQLWQFKEKMLLQNFEIQASNNLLFCQLPDAAIALATTQYGAHQVEPLPESSKEFNH